MPMPDNVPKESKRSVIRSANIAGIREIFRMLEISICINMAFGLAGIEMISFGIGVMCKTHAKIAQVKIPKIRFPWMRSACKNSKKITPKIPISIEGL